MILVSALVEAANLLCSFETHVAKSVSVLQRASCAKFAYSMYIFALIRAHVRRSRLVMNFK